MSGAVGSHSGAVDLAFLDGCGLAALADDDKASLLAYVIDELEMAVGTALTRHLTDAELDEFSALVDGDHRVLRTWVRRHAPELLPEVDGPHGDEVADRVSTLWLQMRCPGYEQVVHAERARVAAALTAAAPRLLSRPHA